MQELRKLKELNISKLKEEDALIFYVNDISKDELGVIGYLQYGTIISEKDYVTFLPPLAEEASYKFLINKILTYQGENILNFIPTDSITAEKYPVKLLLGKIQKAHLAEIKKGMVITKFRTGGKYSNFKWGNKFVGTLYLIYHPTPIKTQTSSNLVYNLFNTKCYFHQFKTSKDIVTNSVNTSEFVKCWIETDEKIPLLKEITTDGGNYYGFFILYEGERAMAVGSIDKLVENWEFKSIKE